MIKMAIGIGVALVFTAGAVVGAKLADPNVIKKAVGRVKDWEKKMREDTLPDCDFVCCTCEAPDCSSRIEEFDPDVEKDPTFGDDGDKPEEQQ